MKQIFPGNRHKPVIGNKEPIGKTILIQEANWIKQLHTLTSYTNFGFLREIKENTTESCSTQSASDLKILLPTGSLYPIKIKFDDFISIFLE